MESVLQMLNDMRDVMEELQKGREEIHMDVVKLKMRQESQYESIREAVSKMNEVKEKKTATRGEINESVADLMEESMDEIGVKRETQRQGLEKLQKRNLSDRRNIEKVSEKLDGSATLALQLSKRVNEVEKILHQAVDEINQKKEGGKEVSIRKFVEAEEKVKTIEAIIQEKRQNTDGDKIMKIHEPPEERVAQNLEKFVEKTEEKLNTMLEQYSIKKELCSRKKTMDKMVGYDMKLSQANEFISYKELNLIENKPLSDMTVSVQFNPLPLHEEINDKLMCFMAKSDKDGTFAVTNEPNGLFIFKDHKFHKKYLIEGK